MNKNLKIVLEIVLYIIIIGGITVGTPKFLVYIMGTDYPVASITSGSMWPALKKGDLVLIKYVEKSQLEVGDIVVYRNSEEIDDVNSGFTIHRIIKINGEEIITQGDANNVQDKPITYEKIIGRAIEYNNNPVKIPKVGNITIWFSQNK